MGTVEVTRSNASLGDGRDRYGIVQLYDLHGTGATDLH
jgi:hypothetical protein